MGTNSQSANKYMQEGSCYDPDETRPADYYDHLEREHMGDPDKKTGIYAERTDAPSHPPMTREQIVQMLSDWERNDRPIDAGYAAMQARRIIYALDHERSAVSETGAQNDCAALQAKIDRLMLEYCPDEMTPEQIENWGKHQRAVSLPDAPDLPSIPTVTTTPKGNDKPVAWLWEWIGDRTSLNEGRKVARTLEEMDPANNPYPDSWKPVCALYERSG